MPACPAAPDATGSGALGALSVDQVKAALTLARGGTVSAAAHAIGVHRSSIYNWFKNDPSFKQAIEEIRRDRNERLRDHMRDLDSLALSLLLRILADGCVSPAAQLRAALAILKRPKEHGGLEEWNLPHMESLGNTIDRRPLVAEPPSFDTTRHISTQNTKSQSRQRSLPPNWKSRRISS
jgi:AcrR family transcriptional regulator